jgi:hypothetical protein
MATLEEFEKAFENPKTNNIVVRSRNGKDYWMHRDQLQFMPDGLIYGSPLKPTPRAKRKVFWMAPENVTIISEGEDT